MRDVIDTDAKMRAPIITYILMEEEASTQHDDATRGHVLHHFTPCQPLGVIHIACTPRAEIREEEDDGLRKFILKLSANIIQEARRGKP